MGRRCCIPGHKMSQGQLLPATRTQITARTLNQRRHICAITFLFLVDFPKMAIVFMRHPIVITISAFSDINHAVKDARSAAEAPAYPKNRKYKYI